MSTLGDTLQRVRRLFVRDKEQAQLRLSQGATSSFLPGSSFDLLQSYGFDVVADYLRLEQDLMSRFVDYESMDDYGEVAAILNIYGDDSTQPDTPTNRRIWIESPDRDLQQLGNDFLHRVLRFEEDSWSISRQMCKMGNDYEEIVVHPDDGVVALNHLPTHTVRRVEGPRGELYGFVQDFNRRVGYTPKEFHDLVTKRLQTKGSSDRFGPTKTVGYEGVIPFEPWQVAHFRHRGKHRRSVYGYSVLEPARWIWKRLILLEDAALIYRLQRAPERYAFYVDVGNRPLNEALRLLHTVRQQYKKKKYINPRTNKLDLKLDMLAQDEDIFIPVVNGAEATRVEVLGGPSWQHMEDIEYFLNKLFGSLHVPKAYLSQEEGVNRAILSSEDVRFARTILRVQQDLRLGVEKIFRVHLAAIGIPPDAVEFDVRFTVPSSIFELAQLEVKNARADFASRVREHVSLRWVLENVYNLNEDEIKTVVSEREHELIQQSDVQGRADATMQKHTMGMGGGGMMMSRPLPQVPSLLGLRSPVSPGITLQELEAGNRAAERRAKGQIDQMLRSNYAISRKVNQLRGLVQDLHYSHRGRAAR